MPPLVTNGGADHIVIFSPLTAAGASSFVFSVRRLLRSITFTQSPPRVHRDIQRQQGQRSEPSPLLLQGSLDHATAPTAPVQTPLTLPPPSSATATSPILTISFSKPPTQPPSAPFIDSQLHSCSGTTVADKTQATTTRLWWGVNDDGSKAQYGNGNKVATPLVALTSGDGELVQPIQRVDHSSRDFHLIVTPTLVRSCIFWNWNRKALVITRKCYLSKAFSVGPAITKLCQDALHTLMEFPTNGDLELSLAFIKDTVSGPKPLVVSPGILLNRQMYANAQHLNRPHIVTSLFA
ncbi:hypothetical protein EDB86DRAFT_3184218 [Lactarius hatsudake]|nr:hypothetical protein EDB86DRAFT_3184218 [Lactarius hatsudake]